MDSCLAQRVAGVFAHRRSQDQSPGASVRAERSEEYHQESPTPAESPQILLRAKLSQNIERRTPSLTRRVAGSATGLVQSIRLSPDFSKCLPTQSKASPLCESAGRVLRYGFVLTEPSWTAPCSHAEGPSSRAARRQPAEAPACDPASVRGTRLGRLTPCRSRRHDVLSFSTPKTSTWRCPVRVRHDTCTWSSWRTHS